MAWILSSIVVILLLSSWEFTASNATSIPYKYVGCYIDKHQRALDDKFVEDYNAMTTDKCINICADIMGNNAVYYAGTQYAFQCFCGTQYDKYGIVSESQCSKPCSGDSSEMCGGTWRSSVYEITATPILHKYVGCYIDKHQRALDDKFVEDYNSMTTDKCINICADMMGNNAVYYAGTQYAFQCFCGTQYDKYGIVSDSQCSKPCSGESSEMCGGTWRLSVYEIKKV